jgi:hypothetical protein
MDFNRLLLRPPASVFVLLIASAIWQSPGGAEAASVDDVRTAIKKHAANLARIKTIYVKVELTNPQRGGSPATKILTSESWRSGRRERMIVHNYAAGNPEEATDRFTIESFSETEGRSLQGWDPRRSNQVPIKRTSAAFDKVIGYIIPRDPDTGGSFDWFRLEMELWQAMPLAEVAKLAEIVPLEASSADIVRFSLKSTVSDASLGGEFELDRRHGYLIRSWKKDDGSKIVDEFAQFADGIWLPKHLRFVDPKSEVTRIDLLSCRVNEPIPSEELSIKFPTGCKVVEMGKDLIHIWGNEVPERTFHGDAEFMQYRLAILREAQGIQSVNAGHHPLWRMTWLWVNIVALITLVALFVIRNRFFHS